MRRFYRLRPMAPNTPPRDAPFDGLAKLLMQYISLFATSTAPQIVPLEKQIFPSEAVLKSLQMASRRPVWFSQSNRSSLVS